MKKIIITVLALAMCAGSVSAGSIATIIGSDMLVGAAAGGALGAALSTPSFLEGGSKDAMQYAIGASWGVLIGAGVGFIYSFVDISMRGGSAGPVPQKKAFLGTGDLYVSADGTYINLVKKF